MTYLSADSSLVRCDSCGHVDDERTYGPQIDERDICAACLCEARAEFDVWHGWLSALVSRAVHLSGGRRAA